MKRSTAAASSSRRRRSCLLEAIEPRVLMSTTVLNADGSTMGSLEDLNVGSERVLMPTRKRGTAGGDGAPGFQITLNFVGGLSTSQQNAFIAAANRWQRIITADLPDTSDNGTPIDDVLIDASGWYIDGPGHILGQAGPTASRGDSGLTARGTMNFDAADLSNMESNGTLYDVISHEMGHVLGIGTHWTTYGLLQGSPTDRIFAGPNATHQYTAYKGVGSFNAAGVPVETDGGAGTADSHWDDDTFQNELMTGYIGSQGNPLSRMTAASLIDIGYPGVNIDAAEGFDISGWNRAPFIYDFNSNQTTVYPNGALTLSVANATDADNSPLTTKFYRESNGIPGLQSTGAVTNSPRGSAVTPDTLLVTMPPGVLGASFVVGNLPIGAYTFYGQSYDIFDRPSGVVSRTINVITPPPAAPSVPDLLNLLDYGDSDTDNITWSNNLTFTGTAEPNSNVTLLVNGVAVTSKAADGAGHYGMLINLPNDGTYAVAARATNSTGTGAASATMNVTVDTVAPDINYGYFDRQLTEQVSVIVGDGRANHLNWSAPIVTNLTTGARGPAASGLITSNDGSFAALQFASHFADGNYRIQFPLGTVTDVAGNVSPEYNYYFTQLNGDANFDGVVNFDDLVILSQHYGTTGNYFSEGNFDYSSDGKVDFSDLVILAQHYNASLSSVAAITAAPPIDLATAKRLKGGQRFKVADLIV